MSHDWVGNYETERARLQAKRKQLERRPGKR